MKKTKVRIRDEEQLPCYLVVVANNVEDKANEEIPLKSGRSL